MAKKDIDNLTEEERKMILFAELQKLRLVDLNLYPYRTQQQIVGTYSREDLKKWLSAPELDTNQKQLRKISRFLNNASTQYKRLIWYFSNILTLDYYVEPYDLDVDKVNKKSFKKAYQKSVNTLEMLNVKHEFNKILQDVYKDGVYYGYLHIGKDSCFYQPLDPDFCKITFIDDGNYGISFNYAYFFNYPERLAMYPQEFKDTFDRLTQGSPKKKNKNAFYWADLDINNTICIKAGNEYYPIPPFVGLFEEILNISDFKELEKAESEMGNYKLLFQKIPVDEKGGDINKFLITEDFAKIFHNNITQSLPQNVGLITSPMSVEDISFERDKIDKNKVAEATSQYWSEAGVSQLLFNGDTNGSIGVNLSILTDSAIAFGVLRQIERYLNRFLKQINTTYKFRVRMPDVTIFNKQEYQDSLLQAASLGLPVKTQLITSLNMQPSGATNMAFLENEILGLHDQFTHPLVSAHTQSGNPNDEGGRPSQKTVNENGEKTRDNEGNKNRAN